MVEKKDMKKEKEELESTKEIKTESAEIEPIELPGKKPQKFE